MKRLTGLNRQIVLSMSALIVFSTLLGWLAWSIFFAIANEFNPAMLSGPHDWTPTTAEWLWTLVITFVCLLIGAWLAVKLARRILTPINSVMDSVRRVAHGDLAARAVAGDRTLGETAMLVDDFNSMAERLERSARESRTWNAAIAHELRTPVTILRGTLQGVVDGVFKPEEVEFPALLAQVEGLGRLIEDLRTLSLADSGQMQLRLASTGLAQELAELARMLAPQLEAAGLHLRLDICEEAVRCDPARLRQVVLALLDNARRYADPGELQLSLRLAGRDAVLTLEDAGPGMPEELARHAFDPFRRGDGARVALANGSGLGLAVVDAIARAHGGSAACTTGAGGGTLFMVRWPAG